MMDGIKRTIAVIGSVAIIVACIAGCAGAPRAKAISPDAAPAYAMSPEPEMLEAPSAAKAIRAPSASTAGAAEAMPVAQALETDDTADLGGEEYASISENAFKKSADDAVSTFAVDVDTASYSNARRYLNAGRLPPADSIRIEELLNYFDYGWREPTGGAPIALTTELASCPWAPEHRLLAVGLRTRSISAENLPPANLVFLLDTSGSMSDPDKLPLAKRAFSLLAETLRPQDRVAIAVYAGSAGLVLPSTSGSEKAAILGALDGLDAGGSTAGGAGIVLAYETALANFRAGGNNRVILATDGDFNVGLSSESELTRLIESYRDKGVFLSVMGFGQGNVKDARMEALADKGNGNYGYVDSIGEARKILVEEMGATLLTVAKDVKVQVEFITAAVESWRLVGYENRLLAAQDFADDAKDAGEMGAGHRVTALYELVPVAGSGDSIGVARIRYKRPSENESSLLEFPIADQGASFASASDDFRFAAAVAVYGMLLRGSDFKGSSDWDMAIGLARGAAGDDDSGRRTEFAGLAEKAAGLAR